MKKRPTNIQEIKSYLIQQKIYTKKHLKELDTTKKSITSIRTIPQTKSKNKHRKQKLLRFNTPREKAVKTKIGRNFLNKINKHFGEKSKMKKFINKNSVRISYLCMINIKKA